MAMKRQSFVDIWSTGMESLEGGALSALTVLSGEEPFVKERLIDAAIRGYSGDVETFTQRSGESDKLALQRLLDTWATSSLFGSGQLIIARDVGALLKGKLSASLEDVIGKGAPPNRLLLTVPALDGRSKLAKRIKKEGGLVALPPLRDAPPPWHTGGPFLETDLNEWTVAEARLSGLTVSLAVANELSLRIGNEPGRIAQTLNRLMILLEGETRLDKQTVAEHVPRSSVRLLAVYEDALRLGNVAEALQLVDRMKHVGVYDPFMKLVTGPAVADTILRGLTASLSRELTAHERLGPALVTALTHPPWKRSAEQTTALDAALGKGGRRVFLERDLRRSRVESVSAAFSTALVALRRLRDGEGLSLHAITVRLAQSFQTSARGARR
ncbi:MAG: DNA polymerase III delta subunit [Pseudohongiellaceae bacterium]|jgi:DNA polymerase III delta subunit